MVVNNCVRKDLNAGIRVPVEQESLSLSLSYDRNQIVTILNEVRVILVQDYAIYVVTFDFKFVILDIRSLFSKESLNIFAGSPVHVELCLSVLKNREDFELFFLQVLDHEKFDFAFL